MALTLVKAGTRLLVWNRTGRRKGQQQLRGTYHHRASRRLHPWCAWERVGKTLQVVDY
jgi:hypothetical protein